MRILEADENLNSSAELPNTPYIACTVGNEQFYLIPCQICSMYLKADENTLLWFKRHSPGQLLGSITLCCITCSANHSLKQQILDLDATIVDLRYKIANLNDKVGSLYRLKELESDLDKTLDNLVNEFDGLNIKPSNAVGVIPNIAETVEIVQNDTVEIDLSSQNTSVWSVSSTANNTSIDRRVIPQNETTIEADVANPNADEKITTMFVGDSTLYRAHLDNQQVMPENCMKIARPEGNITDLQKQ